jgi:hypothetical protein
MKNALSKSSEQNMYQKRKRIVLKARALQNENKEENNRLKGLLKENYGAVYLTPDIREVAFEKFCEKNNIKL